MLSYPAKIRRDGNGVTLVFGDFEFGGHTSGKDEAEALRHAPGALKTTISLFMETGLDLPAPGEPRGRKVHMIALPSIVDDAKVELYQAMKASGVKKTELARRMGVSRQVVERLLDLGHTSRIGQLELAFSAIGKRLAIEIRDAVRDAA